MNVFLHIGGKVSVKWLKLYRLSVTEFRSESVLMFFDSLKRIGTFVGESLDYTSRESVYNIQLIFITTILKQMALMSFFILFFLTEPGLNKNRFSVPLFIIVWQTCYLCIVYTSSVSILKECWLCRSSIGEQNQS